MPDEYDKDYAATSSARRRKKLLMISQILIFIAFAGLIAAQVGGLLANVSWNVRPTTVDRAIMLMSTTSQVAATIASILLVGLTFLARRQAEFWRSKNWWGFMPVLFLTAAVALYFFVAIGAITLTAQLTMLTSLNEAAYSALSGVINNFAQAFILTLTAIASLIADVLTDY